MAESDKPIVRMRKISKAFGGVQALKNVDLDLYLGEVHALVGDNAAGKSTLIKTLAGAIQKDAGTISFEGNEVEIGEPRDAKALGAHHASSREDKSKFRFIRQSDDSFDSVSTSQNCFSYQSSHERE